MSISVNESSQPLPTAPLQTPAAAGTLGSSSVSKTASSESQATTAQKCDTSSQSIIVSQGEVAVTEPTAQVTVTTTTSNEQASHTSSNTEACANPILHPTSQQNGNIQNDPESDYESGYETDNSNAGSIHQNYSEPGNSPGVGATSTSSSESKINDTIPNKGLNNTNVGNTRGLGDKGKAALRQLSNLSFSRSAGPGITQGPGGNIDLSLPTYDPTSKESILQFLTNSNVQGRLHCKGNHIIFVDHDRGSFLFIENGDFSKARSIIVHDGKSKNPVTNPKDLEMLVAKFCVGFNTIKADWQSRIEPMVEGKAGVPGDFTHLHLSLKFGMAAVYGPRNNKEGQANYTPSIWRRGHQVNAGPIFDDVGPLERVAIGKGSGNDDTISFSTETSEPYDSTGKTESGNSGGGAPVVNVNVTVGGANVTVGGTNVTVNSGNSDQGTPVSNGESSKDVQDTNEGTDQTKGTDDTNNADNTINDVDSGYGSDDDMDGIEDEPESAPPMPTPATILSQMTKIQQNVESSEKPGLQDILTAVRAHLDVVYPNGNQGDPIKVNQNLGDVIKAVESGVTPEPTKPEGMPVAHLQNQGITPLASSSTSNSPETKAATRVTTSNPKPLLAFSGPIYENNMSLEELLKRTRAQTDKAFDQNGDYVGKEPLALKKVIDEFKEETGSGGIIGVKQHAAILQGNNNKEAFFKAAGEVAAAMSNMLSAATPNPGSEESTGLANEEHPLYRAAQELSQKMQSMLGDAATSRAYSTPLENSPDVAQPLTNTSSPSKLPDAAKALSVAMQNMLGDINNTLSPNQGGNDLIGAAKQLSNSMVTLLATATAETATSSPVSGEKTTATPLSNSFLEACRGVTNSLEGLAEAVTSTTPTPSKSPEVAITGISGLAAGIGALNHTNTTASAA